MNKSTIETFVGYLNSASINKYSIRYCDGAQIAQHGSDSCYVALTNDAAVIIETKNNYGNKAGAFNIKFVDYDDIFYIGASDLTVREILDVLDAAGITVDDQLKTLINTRGGRVSITPSDGNIQFDANGNEIIAKENLLMPRITK